MRTRFPLGIWMILMGFNGALFPQGHTPGDYDSVGAHPDHPLWNPDQATENASFDKVGGREYLKGLKARQKKAFAEAAAWFLQSATQDYPPGQHMLATAY